MKHKNLLLYLFFCACVFCTLAPGAAAIEFFDGDIVVHGKISQQVLMRAKSTMYDEKYDYDFFNARTSLKLETMWHAYQGPEYEINVYGVWKNFYDYAHEFDSGYKNYLRDWAGNSSHSIQELKSYETFRDICRELYVEFISDLFQVRLGKQIVSWGDLGFERMADIVNPIDLRGMLNPAYPDFAELKRGLWMMRLYLTPHDMPMDMTFEFLVIPDFEPNRNWPAGYHLSHPPSTNIMANPNELFLPDYRDRPKSWRKPEFGFRVRGYLAGFDWTLQYLHHRDDNAVFRTGKAIEAQLPAIFGRGRPHDVKDFKWMNSFALTFNKTIDRTITLIPFTKVAMSGTVLSFESIYDLNKDTVQLVGAKNKLREYDRYAFAVNWKTKIYIPRLSDWNRNELLNSETTLFMEWVPENKRTYFIYPYLTYRKKGHHWSMVTQTLYYELWNARIIPAVYAAYYVDQGGGYYAPAISFKPQFRWTFILRYMNYFDLYHGINDKDFFTFEITYEF